MGLVTGGVRETEAQGQSSQDIGGTGVSWGHRPPIADTGDVTGAHGLCLEHCEQTQVL